MKFISVVLFLSLTCNVKGFVSPAMKSVNGASARNTVELAIATTTANADTAFTNPDTTGIVEQACIDAAQLMQRVAVPVSSDISPSETVGISYIHWPVKKKLKNVPPVILIHGFDSSGLEYRRLGPKLAAKGVEVYAVDILGWGFTQLDDVTSFSANAKVEALKGFIESKFGKDAKFVIAGASLGGAAAIELAAAKKETCAGLILIDAQGFVDGLGPMALMPKPLAKLGVGVLKSVPLRNSANQMSYFDTETFATEEAQVIGRLHCLRDGWSDAMVSYMQSGGFSPSAKVGTIPAPSLILWGREDGILDGTEYANKFVEMMPDARLQWIEECGHVPHLEKPEETATAITEYLTSEVCATNSFGTASQQLEGKQPTYIVGAGFFGALALSEAIKLLSQ